MRPAHGAKCGCGHKDVSNEKHTLKIGNSVTTLELFQGRHGAF